MFSGSHIINFNHIVTNKEFVRVPKHWPLLLGKFFFLKDSLYDSLDIIAGRKEARWCFFPFRPSVSANLRVMMLLARKSSPKNLRRTDPPHERGCFEIKDTNCFLFPFFARALGERSRFVSGLTSCR